MSSSGIGSFLSGIPITNTTSSSTQYPLWLQSAIEATGSAAGALASQPYQQFPGPQVASPSPQTQQAWQLAGSNIGNWQPNVSQASNLVQGATQPISAGDISTFLNPYQSYITNQLDTNLNQNILPSVQDKFVSAGQSRSPQEAQVTSNAVRDTQNEIGQSLGSAYNGAVGDLLQSRGQQLQGGATLGTLGGLQSQLGLSDVGALAAAGSSQDQNSQANINAAINNFNAQQQWPYQNLSFLSDTLRGLPTQATSPTTTTVAQNGQSPSPLATFAGTLLGGQSLGLARGGRVMPFRRISPLQHLQRAA